MAVTVEMQNTGDPTLQRELEAIIEHIFADRTGDWRVVIMGSQANDRWEMERSPAPMPSSVPTPWKARWASTNRLPW